MDDEEEEAAAALSPTTRLSWRGPVTILPWETAEAARHQLKQATATLSILSYNILMPNSTAGGNGWDGEAFTDIHIALSAP